MFIYALQLASNKYYVGKTYIDEMTRVLDHFESNGSEWTKIYKPISILETYSTENSFEEDNLTKKYMINYGIDNVRGGAYTKIILEEWQIKSLEHEFKSVTDACFKCGQIGHFSNECKQLSIQQYLARYNTEEELDFEIEQMEGIRRRLIDDNTTINDLKYVHIQLIRKDVNSASHFVKIEIEPSIIDKYNSRNYKGDATQIPWHIASIEDLTIQTLYAYIIRKEYFKGLMHSNVVENIYKIYVSRVKKEKQLTEILEENECFVTDFDNSLILINKRIEMLYEKYAKMI
jgi:predicted GIY-YIG superfamily endonuclease